LKRIIENMDERQRFIAAMCFDQPDKIPLEPGWPRESTLYAWRQQGLPEGVDWWPYLLGMLDIPVEAFNLPCDLGVDFKMVPAFAEKVLEHRQGHFIVQDWMGAIVEISDTYDYTYLRTARDFVTRKWHRFPVQDRRDWVEKIRWRYDPAGLGRFPPDFTARCRSLQDRTRVLRMDVNGPFWQLREWCGLEGLCVLMLEQPAFVLEMVEFWTDFLLQMLDQVLGHLTPDHVQVSEDMAYKLHAMISPAMIRRFLLPAWEQWIAALKRAGCPVVTIDSDGYIGELIPLWIEAGFAGTWPVEVAAGNDLAEYRQIYGRQMAYGGGVDKRALAAGGKVMQQELRRLEPVIQSGGYIPGCDHGVPPDISWPNYVEYTRLLAKLTGWL